MDANTRTLKDVLEGDRVFQIPVYQRPYVWDRDRQWAPLWEDVESTALRLVEARTAAHASGLHSSKADENASPHFLGAIVLEQHPTATGDIEVRSVVDGQQRLLTVQLLLFGALDALRELGVEGPPLAKLKKLTSNDKDVVSLEQLQKVLPRHADREPYRRAIAKRRPPADDSQFAEARTFFRDAATEFLEDSGLAVDPYPAGDRLHRQASLLVSTLLGLVKLVVIDLAGIDDAQVIFEALNARNTPLSATDLVKNFLFMRAQGMHQDPDVLYEEVWSRFDREDEWWRSDVGAGHARRARQDWLLGDWLIAQTGAAIQVGRLYGDFRTWFEKDDSNAIDALRSLNQYADAYETLYGRREGATAAERLAFGQIDSLNVAAATPVLLWLLAQPNQHLDRAEREMAFRAIESFVVRRMAMRWQTRSYGQAFVEVLRAAKTAGSSPGRAVVESLLKGPRGYGWPTDEDLVRNFRTYRYYPPGGISQERLRLLLGAVDNHLQAENRLTEPVEIDYKSLHIDHVLPQKWEDYWPVVCDDPTEKLAKEQARRDHLHCIGNLTLTSGPLNQSMSNDPWEAKRSLLRCHSKLRLNELLCRQESWNEQTIEERGEWLATKVAELWPGPGAQWTS